MTGVVVPAYNGSARIGAALKAILQPTANPALRSTVIELGHDAHDTRDRADFLAAHAAEGFIALDRPPTSPASHVLLLGRLSWGTLLQGERTEGAIA